MVADGVERSYHQAAMVDLETHLCRARLKRWAGKSDEEKKATASHASRAYWDAMSPEQRSAEMKKRAKKRKRPRTS